jgi:hypothetical protein
MYLGWNLLKCLHPVTYYFDEDKLAEFTKTGTINTSFIKPASYAGEKQLHTVFLRRM